MDGIADLITAPFYDVVEKSKIALENAGDGQQMLRAAKSLMKEGERALKRIEPLCKRRFEEYGSRFVAALKENDELAKYRKQLNDLLWEFDDYINADDFDADKFAELQALSRDIAPKIYDFLLTIRVKETPQLSSGAFFPQPSPPLSPDSIAAPKFSPAPPIPPRSVTRLYRDSSSSGWTDTGSLGGLRAVDEELEHMVSGVDDSPAMVPEDHNSWAAAPDRLPQSPEMEEEKPPQPPSINPWDINSIVVPGDGQFQFQFQFQDATPVVRRPLVEPLVETKFVDSPPASPPSALFPQLDISPLRLQPRDDHDRPGTSVSYQSHDGGESHRSFDNEAENSTSINPNKTFRKTRKSRTARTNYTIFPTTKKKVVAEQAASHLSVDSTGAGDEAGPHRVRNRSPSIVESLVDPDLPLVRESLIDHHRLTATDSAGPSQSQLGLEPGSRSPRPPSITRTNADHISMVPVDPMPRVAPSTEDCIIDENSSFSIHKGFCAGALEVLEGGIGIKKAKKAGSLSFTLIVARCKSCTYEFDFKQLEFDIGKLDEGNFASHGIGHRLRFLQKSHLPTKKVDEIMYGCVFCHRLGRTLHVSDATVFNSTAALFKHLARHPRPLPEVLGISVVDQEEIPPNLRNDYDLHFRNPPGPHPLHEHAAETAHLPTGVAKEALRKHNASSRPPDGRPVLDVLEGAKVVGITWPDRYHGEWCMGWHDGVHAALPSELVKLDRPDGGNQVYAYNPMSRGQARARLKFAPKEKEWLRFDKDELIRNISYTGSNNNSWCWSGTNAKGKSGIFPQAFIDLSTFQVFEQQQQQQIYHHHYQERERPPPSRRSERASIFGGDESSRTSSILGQLSVRTRTKRSSSITQSISSTESRRRFGSLMSRRS